MPPPCPYHQCHGVIRTGHSLIDVVEYDQAGVAHAWTSVSKQSSPNHSSDASASLSAKAAERKASRFMAPLEQRHHAFAAIGRGMDISRSEHVEFAAGAYILQMVMPDERSHID